MLLQKERFVQLQKTHPPSTLANKGCLKPWVHILKVNLPHRWFLSEQTGLPVKCKLQQPMCCCWVDVNPYIGDLMMWILFWFMPWVETTIPYYIGNNGSHVKPVAWVGATSHPWWHYILVAGTCHPLFSHCCWVGGRSTIGVCQNYCDTPNPQIPNCW